jgi:regulator of protease activity HflC (stomatin/prohibitin superfamily)
MDSPSSTDLSAELVYNWRQKIIDLLSTAIDPEPQVETDPAEEIKAENEYYAQALQAQGDLEAYLIAYAAAVTDRKGKRARSLWSILILQNSWSKTERRLTTWILGCRKR